MPRPKSPVPGYCHHRQSGRAYITIDGRQIMLPGRYDSAESRAAYDRLVADYLRNGRSLPTPLPTGPTVSMIALAFWKFAKTHYVAGDGTPTREADNFRPALAALRRLYGPTDAAAFGPRCLKALRRSMLLEREHADPATGETTTLPGWSRGYANRQVGRIKAVFRWAASEEMVPAATAHALATVDAIRKGREGARETAPVGPVDEAVVDKTLPHMPPPVAALARLQLLTGARGGELFRLRTCDIDRSGDVWKFQPAAHKTAHHGLARTIRFGPRAIEVLTPLLRLDLQAFLFAPADALAWRTQRLSAKRKTPITPSQRRRAEAAAGKPRRKVKQFYTKNTYGQAIARACAAAGVTRWHPHQLRHSAGGRYRRDGDFETAKIILGHSSPQMTEVYAQRDERKADDAAARIG
jgi:integrase